MPFPVRTFYLPESIVVVAVGFLISIQIGVYKILDSRSDALYTEQYLLNQ